MNILIIPNANFYPSHRPVFRLFTYQSVALQFCNGFIRHFESQRLIMLQVAGM